MSKIERIQVEKNFYLDEFIPKQLYLANPTWKLYRLIDKRLFALHQKVRDRHGAMTLNDWIHGGKRNWSGLRLPNSSYYSLFSDHSYGRAGDNIMIKDINEVWNDIKTNYKKIYQPLGLTMIETGKEITWLHMGIGNTNMNSLFEIKMD